MVRFTFISLSRCCKNQRVPPAGAVCQAAKSIVSALRLSRSTISRNLEYATLSTMRCFVDYLVRQGLGKIHPFPWMKGPEITPFCPLPKRMDLVSAQRKQIWCASFMASSIACPFFASSRPETLVRRREIRILG
jgi:hypothetical protein